jgi:hypothetical protein
MRDGCGHGRLKNVAFPAGFHFLLPAFLDFPVTYGPIDEPAQIPQFEFPCRAVFLVFFWAILRRPAFLSFLSVCGANSRENKQELPLNMGGYPSPSLLKALYGLEGRAKKLGGLNLRLAQKLSNFGKLDSVHLGASFSFPEAASKSKSSRSS